jgi:hypothetical protein
MPVISDIRPRAFVSTVDFILRNMSQLQLRARKYVTRKLIERHRESFQIEFLLMKSVEREAF